MDGLISGVAWLHADLLRKGVGGSIRYSRSGSQRPLVVLVGAGRMGHHHARALERGAAFRLVGIVDPLEPDWADVHWERDLETILARLEPDAAIVAVPPALHAQVALQCLSAGCHVLMEKPICPCHAEAIDLAETFQRAGKVLFGGHCERFHPVFTALCEHVEPETVDWIQATRTGPRPQRSIPEGILLDLAIHDVDLALRLLGPLGKGAVEQQREDAALVRFRSDRGASVDIVCGYQAGRTRRWEIQTSGVRYDADFLGRSLLRIRGDRLESLRVGEGDPLELEHRAFRRAMDGRDCTLDLGCQIESIGLLERFAADQRAK